MKGIRPQNLTSITPHGMYFPSTPLPSPPSLLLFLVSEKGMVGGLVFKEDVREGE